MSSSCPDMEHAQRAWREEQRRSAATTNEFQAMHHRYIPFDHSMITNNSTTSGNHIHLTVHFAGIFAARRAHFKCSLTFVDIGHHITSTLEGGVAARCAATTQANLLRSSTHHMTPSMGFNTLTCVLALQFSEISAARRAHFKASYPSLISVISSGRKGGGAAQRGATTTIYSISFTNTSPPPLAVPTLYFDIRGTPPRCNQFLDIRQPPPTLP
ncbi:hypothetical protein B0H34DRAFT_676076 [Crassisporium funariophilum]|nr:hypothetical protein B0H34DRAFT_676076 [Crassisporium funariophilum]